MICILTTLQESLQYQFSCSLFLIEGLLKKLFWFLYYFISRLKKQFQTIITNNNYSGMYLNRLHSLIF